ncbi:hypothetical protein F4824DRAFT_493563 [Ustulina deusta]|nr:hypothetical protein F4824DRAFT_493563 [Ustulina deusta]
MAGLQHYRMVMDPAIQKLGKPPKNKDEIANHHLPPTAMTSNRHKYFRWTPRTAGLNFVYLIVVPSILGVIAYQTDVRGPLHPSPSQPRPEPALPPSASALLLLHNALKIDA